MGSARGRLRWARALLAVLFILAACRLAHIQLAQGPYLARAALHQELAGVSLEEYARGQILDRKGNPLALPLSARRVLVFPEILTDKDRTAAWLAAVLEVERDDLAGKMEKGAPFLIFTEIGALQADEIEMRNEEGVAVVPYLHRYGENTLAVHVLGHLGRVRDLEELEELNNSSKKRYSLGDWIGRQGLEHYYEEELKGQYPAAYAGLFKDALGNVLAGMPFQVSTSDGDLTRSDVITTLDAGVQAMVERVMEERSVKGAVVVMDRATGDILAMASRPDYNPDPNILGKELPGVDDERFYNQCTALFQPGSIFKLVVAAAALSEEMAAAKTIFECRGSKAQPVPCWNSEGHGTITLERAFAESCNPVFVELGSLLGADLLTEYARRLGLENQQILGFPLTEDKRQSLELIGEKYNLASSCVGQGPVLATPVQITAMINTVANGGLYTPPRLVKEIRPARGATRYIAGGAGEQVISLDVARELGRMMVMVTTEGVGRKAWVGGGGTAGKTGSAQLVDGSNRVNAWFSGYGPVDTPAYAVTVLVREGISGGETAAPIFQEIMDNLLSEDMLY